MSSTNKTANLGLPQWEGTDTVEHGDFNGAFAKIDEAIRQINEAIDGRVRKKLADVTIEREQSSVTIELSEAEMEGVTELELTVDLANGSKHLRINGKTDSYEYKSQTNSRYDERIQLPNGASRIYINRTNLIFRPVEGHFYYIASGSGFLPPKTLEIISEETNYRIYPGDRITVWGIKK